MMIEPNSTVCNAAATTMPAMSFTAAVSPELLTAANEWKAAFPKWLALLEAGADNDASTLYDTHMHPVMWKIARWKPTSLADLSFQARFLIEEADKTGDGVREFIDCASEPEEHLMMAIFERVAAMVETRS